jgi:hypothetical protein
MHLSFTEATPEVLRKASPKATLKESVGPICGFRKEIRQRFPHAFGIDIGQS